MNKSYRKRLNYFHKKAVLRKTVGTKEYEKHQNRLLAHVARKKREALEALAEHNDSVVAKSGEATIGFSVEFSNSVALSIDYTEKDKKIQDLSEKQEGHEIQDGQRSSLVVTEEQSQGVAAKSSYNCTAVDGDSTGSAVERTSTGMQYYHRRAILRKTVGTKEYEKHQNRMLAHVARKKREALKALAEHNDSVVVKSGEVTTGLSVEFSNSAVLSIDYTEKDKNTQDLSNKPEGHEIQEDGLRSSVIVTGGQPQAVASISSYNCTAVDGDSTGSSVERTCAVTLCSNPPGSISRKQRKTQEFFQKAAASRKIEGTRAHEKQQNRRTSFLAQKQAAALINNAASDAAQDSSSAPKCTDSSQVGYKQPNWSTTNERNHESLVAYTATNTTAQVPNCSVADINTVDCFCSIADFCALTGN